MPEILTPFRAHAAWIMLTSSVFLLLYVYLLYPVLLGIISRLFRRREMRLGYEPTLSVLICAYNEAASIKEKLLQTLALDYPKEKLEIIVVSDGSSDDTEEIVRSFPDSRVKLMRTTQRLGKTNAQNEGIQLCSGEIVVFSDATTVYHNLALSYLATNYQDAKVGAVSGRYKYFSEGSSPSAKGSILFWDYENNIKRRQSRIGTITGCCGCIYSVRRDAFHELPADIISDLVQPLKVIEQGYSVVFEDRALAYEATTTSASQEWTMRVRVITRAMRGLLSVKGLLNPFQRPWVAFQLWSHKVLRWFVPLYLMGILLGSLLLMDRRFFAMFLILQLCFYTLALMGLFLPLHRCSSLLGLPLYFCTLNLAALVSVVQLLRGRKYVTWETVRS